MSNNINDNQGGWKGHSPSGPSSFCPEGQDLIRQAVDKDNNNQNSEALALYKRAFLHFNIVIENDIANITTKKMIQQLLSKYLNRANEIKKQLKEEEELKEKKRLQPIVANGSTAIVKHNNIENETENELNKYSIGLRNFFNSTIIESPNVKWSDIKGLNNAKALLQECVDDYTKFNQYYIENNITLTSGILLYGPSGK